MAKKRARCVALSVEKLEAREVPAASPWSVQTFAQATPGSLPSDWSQYSTDSNGYQIASNASLTGGSALQSSGASVSTERAWLNAALPADAQVSATILADSLVPAQVIARGQNLDTSTPTYYAVSITRGLQVQLVKVVSGQVTVLDTLQSNLYLSNEWIRVTLTTQGNNLGVQVFRTDTAQYLNANGDWQTASTDAISTQDGAVTGSGQAGLARPAGVAGTVTFNDFVTAAPDSTADPTTLVEENFGTPQPGGLPAGWLQRSSGNSSFQISATSPSLTGTGSLTIANPSTDETRAWLDTVLPANVDVSSNIYVNSLIPAEVIARGQNLGSDAPSYYAVTVTRGLQLQLIKVVDGQTTVLDSLSAQQWLSGEWVHVTFSLNGSNLQAQVYRPGSAQYLDSNGNWQDAPTWALQTTDTSLTNGGRVGVGKQGGYFGSVTFDSLGVTQAAVPQSSYQDNFANDVSGSLPLPWTQWNSNQQPGFQVINESSPGSPNSLASDGASNQYSRTWLNAQQGPDTQISADVLLNSLVTGELLVRGQNLDTSAPSYYAVTVTRGLEVQLLAVNNGQTTVLGSLSSNDWFSGQWANVTLIAQGNSLQIQVTRKDNGEYLNQNGDWQSDPAVAISVTDNTLPQSGYVGVGREASYSGEVLFGNVQVNSLSSPTSPTNPPPTTPPDTTGSGNGSSTVTPPTTVPIVTPIPNPTGGSTSGTVTQPANGTLPSVPQHYPYIRVAELAYYGTPFNGTAQSLLQKSVDLVVSNPAYLNQINQITPSTPQMIYSNASNMYGGMITDWMNYANQHGMDPESAFLHVSQATPFSGASASSMPVNWFWNVQTSSNGTWSNETTAAHDESAPVNFGTAGESLVIGYPEQFNLINFNLSTPAGAGWSAVIEYPTAVDANGNPTAWKTLSPKTDGTNGFTRSGQIRFDPPTDWVMSSIGGSALMYQLRVRTVSDGNAPVANTILADDYVHANGGSSGVIPAFDYSLDTNHTGYLTDAQYAIAVAHGFDARFAYQGRALYPNYGQSRYATNVGNASFQQWAADYTKRLLQANPQAAGVFMDNSLAKIALDPNSLVESIANYTTDYATTLAKINAAIAPNWVLANTSGGGLAVDALAKAGISYLDEAAIRPLAASYSQFEDVAANLERRLALGNGNTYAVLDSLLTNGSPTDARTQIATLAYYYLIADPTRTMLMINGGAEPNSDWSRHWTNAINFNVGSAPGTWSVLDTGQDPANSALTYKVYERQYSNALVLYKPLSYYRGQTGTITDTTATVEKLNGTYRPLQADGTLGAAVTSITLRNGEGAILVPV
ncbi:MAG TPA: hypothetical protein VKS79_21385 [Gemmataceae bacterium]|nr:hypothetical protein [Gemmataceae bacterium]